MPRNRVSEDIRGPKVHKVESRKNHQLPAFAKASARRGKTGRADNLQLIRDIFVRGLARKDERATYNENRKSNVYKVYKTARLNKKL